MKIGVGYCGELSLHCQGDIFSDGDVCAKCATWTVFRLLSSTYNWCLVLEMIRSIFSRVYSTDLHFLHRSNVCFASVFTYISASSVWLTLVAISRSIHVILFGSEYRQNSTGQNSDSYEPRSISHLFSGLPLSTVITGFCREKVWTCCTLINQVCINVAMKYMSYLSYW